jgi:hypothetical protein
MEKTEFQLDDVLDNLLKIAGQKVRIGSLSF